MCLLATSQTPVQGHRAYPYLDCLMSLNLTPKRERYLLNLSESLLDFFAMRETANSLFAASAAVSKG